MASIRVLFVDDNDDDVFIATHRLKQAGLNISTQTVAMRDELKHAIDSFHPDVILSDMSLPGFSGFDAFDIARDSDPDVPFLFLCGSPERCSQAALEKGAFAIVDKDRADALPDLINSALSQRGSQT